MRATDVDAHEDWTRLSADEEPAPDHAWVYYMSELKTVPYEHNVRFEKLLEELFDDFGVDLGNSLMDVDPTEVAAGVLWKEPYKVEHRQLGKEEVRDAAEGALERRYKKPWETSGDTETDSSDPSALPLEAADGATVVQIFL